MKQWKHWVPLAIVIVSLVTSFFFSWGDGNSEANPPVNPAPSSAPTVLAKNETLEDPEPIALAELLQRPRAELAALAAEYEQKVQAQDDAFREGRLQFLFLPEGRFPLAWAIWQKAHYSPAKDMLLPPYLPEGNYDAGLALHLARHGDGEAARKLADPAASKLQAQITSLALTRNFPAEWTRLVALILDKAHFNLAAGDFNGARRIVSIHQQLLTLLDDKARQSPLGAVLLPRGRAALQQAIPTWRKSNEGNLAKLGEQVLAGWGNASAVQLPPVQQATGFAQWVDSPSQGFLVAAKDSQRARDVLGLPLPGPGLQNIVGLLGPQGNLQEILVVYSPDLLDIHEPRHLTYWWDENLAGSQGGEPRPEVLLVHGNALVGPLVRISVGSPEGQPIDLSRDFGRVHLDRGFEHNRRLTAWKQSAPRVVLQDAKILNQISNPLAGQKLNQVVLHRASRHDLLAKAEMHFAASSQKSFLGLASPLWQTLGAAQLKVTGNSSKDSLDLTWQGDHTKYCLRLFHGKETSTVLEVQDISPKQEQRLELVRTRDEADRSGRWAEKNPLTLLPRYQDFFELGMSRPELERKLTRTNALQEKIDNGLLITFPEGWHEESDWTLRQAVVRFDAGSLVEARLRYTDAPGKKPGSVKGILEAIRKQSGAAEVIGLPETSSKSKEARQELRWLDDTTCLLGRQEEMGVELVLKDCPREHSLGRPLAPLGWLPRGPEKCNLGTKKEQLLQDWQVKTPVAAGEALLLTPAKNSPFDSLLVWFSGDQVSRVVARHREPQELTNPAQAGNAVLEAWGQQAQTLGWPAQQETHRKGLQALTNRDDLTQVRIFWQDNDGLFLFTEWK